MQYTTESSFRQLPKIALLPIVGGCMFPSMETSEKKAFSARLVKAMKKREYVSQRNSASGVDVAKLKSEAKVTYEMARRYTLGLAIPEPDKLARIAKWLGVRRAWLRDGEGGMDEEKPEDDLGGLGDTERLLIEGYRIANETIRAGMEMLADFAINGIPAPPSGPPIQPKVINEAQVKRHKAK